jgi:5'-nucleotidase
MSNRRQFIKQTAIAAGGLFTASPILRDIDDVLPQEKITILHTNDVHSRIDAFPMDGGRNQGLGGIAARSALIREIRQKEKHVLLLDAGDIFQGTPYFNFFKGEPEIKGMTAMGYDAGTMGNHDFDAGLENFATQWQHASFPLIISNYDFSSTPMENRYKPYTIINKGKLKIGITGVGIELKGLVPDQLAGNTRYLNPIESANEQAFQLKQKKRCDLVICLSHLGYKYADNKVSDEILAKESDNIDLIIGGHTHTFLDSPVAIKNKNGNDVVVNQVGWGGIILGRLDYNFYKGERKNLIDYKSIIIQKKSSE